ncbi:terminase small subunit [Adhaeribacter radiodurans]|uniref:Terminase small subunit n=1 Tax=Adhaeribacter radiodurans TaxID=2745197 RepID=A0A7L7LBB7_9BACT|nr:terminase small subunit [Adhaeribacter radiodurans]QMU30138.1 terminase small subunit [Adhaeribacter radiodurans]
MNTENTTLTDKQERFCQEYLIDLNATQAAIRAGYSRETANEQGSQNLAKLSIHARIRELKSNRAEQLHLDAFWVLKRLIDISNRAMQVEPVLWFNPETKQMEETGEYRFDSAGAVKATELIGKHIGFFEEHNSQKKPETIIKNTFSLKRRAPLPVRE